MKVTTRPNAIPIFIRDIPPGMVFLFKDQIWLKTNVGDESRAIVSLADGLVRYVSANAEVQAVYPDAECYLGSEGDPRAP